MILALISGVFLGDIAIYLKEVSVYILALMMLVSLISISYTNLKFNKSLLKNVVLGIFLNFVLFGILLMGLVSIFYPVDSDIFKGFLLIVAAPPGVVIIPFTLLYKGNINFSVITVLASSILVVILIPIFSLLFLGKSIDLTYMFKILFITIAIPLLLSFFLKKTKVGDFFKGNRGKLIDWSFFIIVYIVIGLNKDVIYNKTELLVIPIIILIILLFLFGTILEFFFRKFFGFENAISYTLILFVKNNPFSAVVSLQLIGELAAIPSVALSIVLLAYLIYFSIKAKKSLSLGN